MHPKYLSINDYNYDLPQDKIAMYPLKERDDSKLLVYSGNEINEFHFRKLPALIPGDAMLIFNDSKVIPARLIFRKETGAKIEVFCLEPDHPATGIGTTGTAVWKCMVGGASRWKEPFLEKIIPIDGQQVILKATLIEKSNPFLIKFNWEPGHLPFYRVLDAAGLVPLPPYIKREMEEEDRINYQTVYAENAGSVAAPTAGLHFTESVMTALEEKGISLEYLTLHVGAGTFKPVDAEQMEGHQMHSEWIEVKRKSIERILNHKGPVIAVGTTSTRTLETLYWLGVKVMQGVNLKEIGLKQWDVYEKPLSDAKLERSTALRALYDAMNNSGSDSLICQTSLLIAPGYDFRVVNGIITNFHQPKSTLLLLVAAATGKSWRKIYDYALNNDFRFLSYGDSSLITVSNG
jgi:S-adenosylmethionine:tRNA ribosyltransferase-isomerase